MQGTIYDTGMTPRLAFDAGPERGAENGRRPASAHSSQTPQGASRVAVISNPRSHGIKRFGLAVPCGVTVASPGSRAELRQTLAGFVSRGVELIIVAGGDGTVRDVLTCGGPLWGGHAPAIAVLPKGKTNALALDLGIGSDWEADDAIAAWQAGRLVDRATIEITRPEEGGTPVRGFLFGAGIFVGATDLAQTTHRLGAFRNLAVGLTVLSTLMNVVFGLGGADWRSGRHIAISAPGMDEDEGPNALGSRNRLIMLVSTLGALPMGMRPFGKRKSGMRTLVADAGIPHFIRNFWRTVRGGESAKLAQAGVHHLHAREYTIAVDDGFILDGEKFPGGDYVLREGAPIAFVTP